MLKKSNNSDAVMSAVNKISCLDHNSVACSPVPSAADQTGYMKYTDGLKAPKTLQVRS